MDWKDWWGYDIYKKLWSLIGGRPWTYIYRDVWHRYEYLVQAQWFFIGLAIYLFLGWEGTLIFWCVYTLGYINGHFFWGRRYVPGQMEDYQKNKDRTFAEAAKGMTRHLKGGDE